MSDEVGNNQDRLSGDAAHLDFFLFFQPCLVHHLNLKFILSRYFMLTCAVSYTMNLRRIKETFVVGTNKSQDITIHEKTSEGSEQYR